MLSGRAELFIAGHPQRFAEGECGNAVAVESRDLTFGRGVVPEEIAAILLDACQEAETVADDVLIAAVEMVVTSAEEGQQREAGRGGIRPLRGTSVCRVARRRGDR